MKNWIRERRDLIIAILVVILILGSIMAYFALRRAVSNFWSGGVQIGNDYAHLDTQTECYIFDSQGQIIGQSVFSISGVIHPYSNKDGYGFSGHMEVNAYPMPMQYASSSFSGFFFENTIRLSNQGVQMISPECEYWYCAIISRARPEIIAVQIFDGSGVVIAISGSSQQQAMENYEYYLAHMFIDEED